MTCGIYAIVNKVNGKRYVGKSSDIERRWANHLYLLKSEVKSKDCNRYLYNSFNKYGSSNFGLEYLQVFDEIDEDLMKDREFFWINHLRTLEREHGYNLRLDSGSKCLVSDETRQLISALNKGSSNPNYGNKWSDDMKKKASDIAIRLHAEGRYSSEETRLKTSRTMSKFWADNQDAKRKMAEKVSMKLTRYMIQQYTRDGTLVKTWESVSDVLKNNPTFKGSPIYSCCDGYKKSYRGFIWKKLSKI